MVFEWYLARQIPQGLNEETAVEEFAHVVGWYDNEWGFACRMLDSAALLGSLS